MNLSKKINQQFTLSWLKALDVGLIVGDADIDNWIELDWAESLRRQIREDHPN